MKKKQAKNKTNSMENLVYIHHQIIRAEIF